MSVRHPSRRRGVIALVLLALVVASMGVIIAKSRGGQPLADPSATPSTTLPPHPTLLVQLRDDGLTNVNNVVMGLDPAAGRGADQYLPQDLVVDLVKGRDETLGFTGYKPIAQAAPLVSAQTGELVDNTFVMDRLAFAALVDAVGGVKVTVDAPVVVQDRYGYILDVIPIGERTLDGPQAALYALYLPPSAPESQRVARFRQVWQALLTELPAQPEQTRVIVGNLGALARSTQPLASLAQFLTTAGAIFRSHQWVTGDLPVTPGELGPLPLSWIDPEAARVQSVALFPASQRTPENSALRVRVHRSGASITDVEAARGQLQQAGIDFVWAGPAAVRPTSTVAVASTQLQGAGVRAAQALGLPNSAVAVDPAATPGAPVTAYLAARSQTSPNSTASTSPSASASASAALPTSPAATAPAEEPAVPGVEPTTPAEPTAAGGGEPVTSSGQ